MIDKIQNTKAFKAMEPYARQMVEKRANRIQIEDAVIQAKNIGLEAWKSQTAIPVKWQKIVEEITLN